MKYTVQIEADDIDDVVRAVLVEHHALVSADKSQHPDDIEHNRKMRKHLKKVIEYFGGFE